MTLRSVAILVACCTLLAAAPSLAAYEKEISFVSDPPGAKVYLRRGRKEEILGTTPFKETISFRSEISVVRLVFKKATHENLELKLSAGQDEIAGKLEPFALSNAVKEADPVLRELLAQLDPLLERRLPALLMEVEDVELVLRAPCRLTRLDGEARLVLFLKLEAIDIDPSLPGKARKAALLKELWTRGVGPLAFSLARELPEKVAVAGILADVAYEETKFSFAVGAHVQIGTELECVPGTQYEQRYTVCAYYVNGVCQGGTQTVAVFNPCMYRVPVTKSELKIDPTALTLANHGRIQYLVSRELVRGDRTPAEAFDAIGLLVSDSAGARLETRGGVPDVLPVLP